jgi:exonuclease VII large subunit
MEGMFRLIVVFLSACAVAMPKSPAYSQTLEEEYQEMLRVSTNYQEYKVVKLEKLNQHHKNALDSLQAERKTVLAQNQELRTLRETKTNLETTVNGLQNEIEKLEEQKDSISFLGIAFTKWGFKLMYLGSIAILALLAVLFYTRYAKSKRDTRKFKHAQETAENSLETYKKSSREKELKLKRELQTALNKLDELRP